MSVREWGLSMRASAPDDRSLALVLALGATSGVLLLPFAPVFAPPTIMSMT